MTAFSVRRPARVALSGSVGASGDVVASAAPRAAEQILAAPHFWTQFSRPQVVQSNGFIYYGTTDMEGDTLIHQENLSTGVTTSFQLSTGGGANGHDSCVIQVLPDGRIMAVWSVQNAQCYRRISTNAHDISAFGTALQLSGATPVSYANVIYLSTPNRHYVHARQGNGGGPGDRICVAWASTNNGSTFGVGDVWITQTGERPYVISCNNGTNRIDFFCTNKHQTDSGPDSFFNLYHCYAVFAADGSKQFYKSDGTLIGSSVTQLSTQATLIYAGASSGPAWNWDICYGSDGHPRVLWVRQATSDDHRHHFSRWTGSAWVSTEIGAAGARLYSTEIWSDGALCFDLQDPDTVYRSVQVGSAWELQQWETTDSGATWAKTFDISTGSGSAVKAVTPRGVVGGDGQVGVLWKKGTISNWNNFSLAVWLAGRQ